MEKKYRNKIPQNTENAFSSNYYSFFRSEMQKTNKFILLKTGNIYASKNETKKIKTEL